MLIVFTAIVGLADAWLVSSWTGRVWTAATTAGAMAGLMLAVAWAIWPTAALVSIGLVIASMAVAVVFLRDSLTAGALAMCVSVGIFGAWVGASQVWRRRIHR